jgi:putative heme degradation protein
MLGTLLDVGVYNSIGRDVVRLEPELIAVLIQLDAVVAIKALDAEVERTV